MITNEELSAALNGELRFGFRWTAEHVRDGVVINDDTEPVCNLVPTEGLNHILSVILKAGTPVSTWYGALFKGNYTPVAGVTAASVVAAATEATEYTSATRLAWVGGTVVGGAVDNVASKFEFTMNAGVTIYGAMLLPNSTKGNGTAPLLSIVRFPTAKVLVNTDILRVSAGLILVSA